MFFNILEHNPGLIILNLGAIWCGPFKTIEKTLHGLFA